MSSNFHRHRNSVCTGVIAGCISLTVLGWFQSAANWQANAAAPQNRKIDNHVPVRDKWALLIGVDLFQDGTVPEIKEAERNVKELAKVLRDPNAGRFAPDHVKIVSGPGATKSGIEAAVTGWLCKKVLPDDMALLYICSASAKASDGAILAYSYDTLNSEKDLSALNLKAIAHDIHTRTQCKNLVMALDLVPAKTGIAAGDFTGLANDGITVLSAAAPDETSGLNGALGISFFVHHLTEALKLNAGAFTLQETSAHLSKTIPADSQACFGRTQTPVFLPGADDPYMSSLSLGMAVRSSMPKQSFSMGHPMDTLALNHPELTGLRGDMRHTGPAPVITSRSTSSGAAKPTQPQKKKPAKDDDDDDDAPAVNVDYKDYMAKMKLDIQKHWTPPKGLENRKIVAMFTIARDGRILNPSIIEGTGVAELDRAALEALHAASPLDPLPPGAPKSVDIKYSFDWHVQRN